MPTAVPCQSTSLQQFPQLQMQRVQRFYNTVCGHRSFSTAAPPPEAPCAAAAAGLQKCFSCTGGVAHALRIIQPSRWRHLAVPAPQLRFIWSTTSLATPRQAASLAYVLSSSALTRSFSASTHTQHSTPRPYIQQRTYAGGASGVTADAAITTRYYSKRRIQKREPLPNQVIPNQVIPNQ